MALLSRTVSWEQVKTKVLSLCSASHNPEAEVKPGRDRTFFYSPWYTVPRLQSAELQCAVGNRCVLICSRLQDETPHLRWRQDLMYSGYQRGELEIREAIIRASRCPSLASFFDKALYVCKEVPRDCNPLTLTCSQSREAIRI